MPRLDKTGPLGRGPLTGRCCGPCCGSGCGCRCGFPQRLTREEDKQRLENERKCLERELKDTEARLGEING